MLQINTSIASTELIIIIYPRGYVEFRGTLAQLKEEGLIPAKLTIPEHDNRVEWRAGGIFSFLMRIRPAAMRGPKQMWQEGDYWLVRSHKEEKTLTECWDDALIYEKSEELEKAKRRKRTSEHQREIELSIKAGCDKAFMAFLEQMNPKKTARRGRKPAY